MLNHTLSILHHIFCCFFIGSSVLHQVSLQLSLIINGGPFQAKGNWPSGSMYVVGRSRQENFSLSLGSTAAAQDSTQASQLEFTWHHKAPHYQLFVLPILFKLVFLMRTCNFFVHFFTSRSMAGKLHFFSTRPVICQSIVFWF